MRAYHPALHHDYCLRTMDAIIDVCVVVHSISYDTVPLGSSPTDLHEDFFIESTLARQWIFPIHSDNFVVPIHNTWHENSGYRCSFESVILNKEAL
jgi:hypothetical protein